MRTVLQIKFKDDTATKNVESRGPMFKISINLITVSFTSLLFVLKPIWAQSVGLPQ